MALTDTPKKVDKKSQETDKKSQDSEKKSQETHRPLDKKEKPLTKVIIRRLPPSIDQETFLNQISPVPDYDYIYLVRGDATLGENSFSRVYINFTKCEDIFDFKEKFDNYVFIDNRGHEYPAVVEFAAFQKIPKKRNKNRVDPKCGTIESDPIYLEFVESLNKPQESEVKTEFSYQLLNETKSNTNLEATTPLLEFIKNKRAEKMRIREERREERKRKEMERRKFRDDERRRRNEEKSPIKSVIIKAQASKTNLKEGKSESDKVDKETSQEVISKSVEKTSNYKTKEKRFDDRRKDVKTKYGNRKDYSERREFKNRRDDYKDRDFKSKYDDRKDTESKSVTKKVKKYSEKREERKIEAQKAEQKKSEESIAADSQKKESKSAEICSPKSEDKVKGSEFSEDPKLIETDKQNMEPPETSNNETRNKEKDTDGSSQKRIRNKDRPTLAIYRPGMLSKRRQTDSESENKDVKKESSKE